MEHAEACALLGLSEEAGPEEVKAAYRTLARHTHPDHNLAIDAHARMSALNAARDRLLDGRPVPGAEPPVRSPPTMGLDGVFGGGSQWSRAGRIRGLHGGIGRTVRARGPLRIVIRIRSGAAAEGTD